jgi:hypothetical protein
VVCPRCDLKCKAGYEMFEGTRKCSGGDTVHGEVTKYSR